MQRNRFLGDLLSQLFDRSSTVRGKDDQRDIYMLCDALMSAEGEVSGLRLASSILARYADLNEDEKLAFFQYLNSELDVDAAHIAKVATDYAETKSPAVFIELCKAAEPKRQELLRRLNQPFGATHLLVEMRVDLLKLLKAHPELARTDIDFVHLLRSWFNRGFLVLKQINWDTPARILDKIVAYEAVHQIDDWDDLRRRLYPPDRRCFAFFHPSMPEEPLIFVEVALTADIPGSIDALLSDNRTPLEEDQAKVAVFYSISNCQKGLTGISFGNLLIKQVVAELSLSCPNIDTFVTLSPIPLMTRWLKAQEDDELVPAANSILEGSASSETMRAMAARYLLTGKRGDGLPYDPVARFHLGNGAEIHEVHAGADSSENGHKQSRGAMVNYLYNVDHTEKNHENFALRSTVKASRTVQTLSTAKLEAKTKEPAS
ncbi:malonyl-CoA decarboxylase domain-containing protein [Pacificibacter marinus]|uniref:malonyl-CoA decarboxylase domain-containing protein n=1 Tax=Pacificibacter marinus TaxID=658057 RepID=UPI001C08E20C|nr:malonyl-CoA decarboxylase family protein [Pacificibacter marinus]MBU2937740.1 malonyl-CoA decarboxylase [Pacificibacter marinus]MDO6616234.1 malonyl-CoA decarboxylase family protein [Pacificibacter sp. 1_MG-2023]